MKLIVDHSSRFAKMRAHTATHLLHSQLAKIFPNTKQEGSQVDNDYLRFDFSSDRLLDQQELASIEKNMNQIIYLACDVTTQEMNIDDASKLGAKMFFEDKYGDTVRVVQITCRSELNEEYNSQGNISIELCGGTHVSNTKDIGCFAIIGQEAVASGIKRITALTGPKVSEKIQEVQSILDITVNKLGIKTPTQLQDKLDKTMREYEEMQSKIESLETQMIINTLKNIQSKSDQNFDKIIKLNADLEFKNISFHAKSIFSTGNILIYNDQGNFLILSDSKQAKELSTKVGLKGGGNENMIQGRDPKVLDIFK
ncbi:MAG: hypothetical protein WAZ12_01655 [Candidatus Absconditicoccaceae bacterium]